MLGALQIFTFDQIVVPELGSISGLHHGIQDHFFFFGQISHCISIVRVFAHGGWHASHLNAACFYRLAFGFGRIANFLNGETQVVGIVHVGNNVVRVGDCCVLEGQVRVLLARNFIVLQIDPCSFILVHFRGAGMIIIHHWKYRRSFLLFEISYWFVILFRFWCGHIFCNGLQFVRFITLSLDIECKDIRINNCGCPW